MLGNRLSRSLQAAAAASSLINDLKPIEAWAGSIATALFLFACATGLSPALTAFSGPAPNTGVIILLSGAGIGLVAALAAAVLGGLLGFLFAIPRSLQRQPSVAPAGGAAPAADTRLFRTNTSFEEISDWLTKIIIGIGLVQFNNIVFYLYISSKIAAYYVVGKPIPGTLDAISQAEASFVAPYIFALIVASLIGSILFCYMETRTRLALLFVGAEKNLSLEDDAASAVDHPAASGDKPDELSTAKPSAGDKRLAQFPLETFQTPTERAGWASAQIRTGGNITQAKDVLTQAAKQRPQDIDVQKRLVDALTLNKDFREASIVSEKLAATVVVPSERIEFARSALWTSLYAKDAPASIHRAIRAAKELIDLGEGAKPMVQVWRAAAYGQLHKWLGKTGGSAAEITDARDGALAAIKDLAALRPDKAATERRVVRGMLKPGVEGTSKTDDDLTSLAADKDIMAAAGF